MATRSLPNKNDIRSTSSSGPGTTKSRWRRCWTRDKSTISRELKRNTGLSGYRPKQAHRRALQRRNSLAWRPLQEPTLGPDSGSTASGLKPRAGRQSARRLSRESVSAMNGSINLSMPINATVETYTSICAVVRNDVSAIVATPVVAASPTRSRSRIARLSSRAGAVFGDWEADTMVGKGHRGAVVSIVERKSRYTFLAHAITRAADAVRGLHYRQSHAS